MARIPHVGGTNNTFGNRGPDRIGPYQPDTRGMTAGLDALSDAARATAGAAQTIAAVRQREREEDEALALAKGQNALADDATQVSAVADDIEARVGDRSLPWDKAAEEFEYQVRNLEQPLPVDLAPDAAERFNGQVKRTRLAASARVAIIAATGKRADLKGNLLQLRDHIEKRAVEPGVDPEALIAAGAQLQDLANAAGMGDSFAKDQQNLADRIYNAQATRERWAEAARAHMESPLWRCQGGSTTHRASPSRDSKCAPSRTCRRQSRCR